MKGATTLVAIIDVPCGIFSMQRRRDEREQLAREEGARNEHHDDRDDRAQQAVAQLHQMGDQRAFRQLLGVVAVHVLTFGAGGSLVSGVAGACGSIPETMESRSSSGPV